MGMILTQAGQDAINALIASNGTLTIAEMSFGGADRHPTGGETELSDELIRKPVLNATVVGQKTRFDARLEVDEGPFTIYELGLHDQNGTLIFISRVNGLVKATGNNVELHSVDISAHVFTSNFQNVSLELDSNFSFVPQARVLSVGAGLTGGGDLTQDRAIGLDFATQAEVLAGQLGTKPVSPATLAAALGKTADGLPLHLELSNDGQSSQNVAKDVAVRCNNMVDVGGNAGALWNGHRFTVDADSLGVYGVLNRLNINNEEGEGAQTWKNGAAIMDYQLGASTGSHNVMPFTHFVMLTNVGDYIEFYHSHKSSGSRTNNGSAAQIYRLQPFTPVV